MTLLRATVTARHSGSNYCTNPGPTQNLDGFDTGSDGNSPNEISLVAPPAASPLGLDVCGLLQWEITDGSVGHIAIPIEANLDTTTNTNYTLSCWVYVPSGSPAVHLKGNGNPSSSAATLGYDQWVRLQCTFPAVANPVVEFETDAAVTTMDTPNSTPPSISRFYFTGMLLQGGTTVNDFVMGGHGAAHDPAEVLVDGADTPIVVNGHPAYTPLHNDRLLVQQVGGGAETIQSPQRTLSTADTGNRIVLYNSPGDAAQGLGNYGAMRFYTDDADETVSGFISQTLALESNGNRGFIQISPSHMARAGSPNHSDPIIALIGAGQDPSLANEDSHINISAANISIQAANDIGGTGTTASIEMSGATGAITMTGGDPWHIIGSTGEPAWQNGAQPATAAPGMPSPAFRKSVDGAVFLRGRVQCTSGTVLFTLPSGYRPQAGSDSTQPAVRHLIMHSGATGPHLAWADIYSDGRVVIALDSGSDPGTYGYYLWLSFSTYGGT